ncbi:TIGR02206 family membrane protein [Bacillus sp. JJ1773]|uniref:YwaF family protein n=1 Tax=Bacillus sp. JJ1773 TaxID=3122965 RepID=UPI002FFDED2C
MNKVFGHEYSLFPFEAFSFQHFMMIIILIGGTIFLYSKKNHLKEHDKSVRILMFLSLFVLEAMYHIWLIKDGYWDISFTLPLQLCSLSLILCLILLTSKSNFIFQIVFFIGITGAAMAVITPELFLGFPHFRYFQFFITHIFIIWTCFYFWIVHDYTPNGKGLIMSFLFLNGSACLAFAANKVTGGNYMFLAYKPSNASLLDYFGPFPYYILALEGATLFFFFLLLVICNKVKVKAIQR